MEGGGAAGRPGARGGDRGGGDAARHGLGEPDDVIDCGNSGTSLRLLAGVLAGVPGLSVLTGDASLRRRPVRRVVEPLRRMGGVLEARDGDRLPPLVIRGQRLRGTRHVLAGGERPGEVGHPAGRPLRRRGDRGRGAGALPRPHRADAPAHGRRPLGRRAPGHHPPVQPRAGARSTCPGTSRRRPSSCAPRPALPGSGSPRWAWARTPPAPASSTCCAPWAPTSRWRTSGRAPASRAPTSRSAAPGSRR